MVVDEIDEAAVVDGSHAVDDAVGKAARFEVGQQRIDLETPHRLAYFTLDCIAGCGSVDPVLDQQDSAGRATRRQAVERAFASGDLLTICSIYGSPLRS